MKNKTFNLVQSQNLQALALYNDLKAIYSETLTVDSTIKNLNTQINTIRNLGLPAPAAIYISVDSDNLTDKVLRYTLDGTNPDPGNFHGIAKKDSDEFLITEFYNIQLFRFIEESANSTTIYVTFFRGL